MDRAICSTQIFTSAALVPTWWSGNSRASGFSGFNSPRFRRGKRRAPSRRSRHETRRGQGLVRPPSGHPSALLLHCNAASQQRLTGGKATCPRRLRFRSSRKIGRKPCRNREPSQIVATSRSIAKKRRVRDMSADRKAPATSRIIGHVPWKPDAKAASGATVAVVHRIIRAILLRIASARQQPDAKVASRATAASRNFHKRARPSARRSSAYCSA